MARTWYPVIDYSSCIECGSCISKCSHGVYDRAKEPAPVVKEPEGCVDHCHGCGNLCPVGAITYLGEDTGWTPPVVKAEESKGDAGDADGKEKTVRVEYLYLDLKHCERCIGTDRELDDVMMTLTPALELAGHRVLYDKTEIKTEELATQYKFLSSPTIRVNGKDICMSVKENDCNCCSDIGGTDVDCRIFEYEGREYEIPPKEMLASAILKIASGADAAAKGGGAEGSCSCSCGDYKLPDNLKNFFDGKEKVNCACGGDSCCG